MADFFITKRKVSQEKLQAADGSILNPNAAEFTPLDTEGSKASEDSLPAASADADMRVVYAESSVAMHIDEIREDFCAEAFVF